MEKRKLEKIGIETSLLGYGCMRLPMTPEGKIDEPVAEQLLDRAIAGGVNYIDSAYYYSKGLSESFVGKILQKYDRSTLYVATKLPLWNLKELREVDEIFEEQLARLRTDYIDFYLMHSLNKEKWDAMVEMGVVKRLEELKAKTSSISSS